MKQIVLLILFSLIFPIFPVSAATLSEPAFRKLMLVRQGMTGIALSFSIDELTCKKNYGKKWREKCAAYPGRYGQTAKGIRMTPSAPGYWEWLDGTTLQFVPKDQGSLKPEARYLLNVEDLSLPASLKLDKREISFTAWPFAALLQNLDFFIDPSPEGRHRLALSLKFNYPAPASFRLPIPVAENTVFGKPEVVWNNVRTGLNMSWPVDKLPEDSVLAKVDCGKIAQIEEEEGRLKLLPPGASGTTSFNIFLPGQNNLFSIKNIAMTPVHNENLDQEYNLEIETSLYAAPEKLLENLLVFQLPEKNSPEAAQACNWELAPGVSPQILEKSRKLNASLLSSPAPRSRFSLRIKPEPGRHVLIQIDKKLKSVSGSALNHSITQILRAQEQGPALEILQTGNILPLAKSGKIDLYASNIDNIHWELKRVAEPFLALLANGRNIFSDGAYAAVNNLDSVSERLEGDIPLSGAETGAAQFAALDVGDLLRKLDTEHHSQSGLAFLTLRGLQNNETVCQTERLVLATELGLLLKQSACGEYECFTQDLESGAPTEDAEIRILAANGRTLAQGNTDKDGRLSLPSLAGLKRESRPVAAIARKDGNLAWLPLEDPARKVDFSAFRTEGMTRFANGLNAFIFGQRGIYRPGEQLNFGLIVKNSDFSPLINELPVWIEILDPRGLTVYGQSIMVNKPGIAEISWKSPEAALTGAYVLNVRAGRGGAILGSENAKIENFLPDALKLQVELPAHSGWLKPRQTNNEFVFRLRNLHGTPASGHKIASSLTASSANFRFPAYADYFFTDPAPLVSNNIKVSLPALLTNSEGEARAAMPSDLASFASARISLFSEGFDASGGRAVTQRADFLYSPAEKLLGYKPLGALTNLGFIPAQSEASLDLLAIDSNLRQVAWDNLAFSISRREFATSLITDASGVCRYDETPLDRPIKSWTSSVTEHGLKVSLPTDAPGDYMLTIKDAGQTVAAVPFSVAGNALMPPGQTPEQARLRIKTDKNAYKGGENIQVSLGLPYDGSGLLTLERDGVAAFARFSAKAGETVQSLEIPAGFEGKGYVVISFARSGNSPAIYMSPHISAAVPVMIDMQKRDMGLTIDAPAGVEPPAKLKVGIQAREAGKAIVYAVDEGIQLLTNYKTPAPLYELLGNRALNVATIQGYDLLMPAAFQSRSAAFGGGSDGLPFGYKFRNPFKRKDEPPLALWAGILDVGPDKTSLEIPVPAWYNGNLRIYAVGASPDCAGSASAATIIEAPLVISPALPLALSPGDAFTAVFDLENATSQDQNLELEWRVDANIHPVSKLPQGLKLGAGSHIPIALEAEALDSPGNACIFLKAASSGKVWERTSCLSIRPASHLRTSYMAGRAAGQISIDSKRQVYAEGASARVLASSLPLPLIDAFKRYLEFYPHGCTEQLISRAFAMLSVRNWLNDEELLKKQLAAAQTALRSRSNGLGAALWPGAKPDLLLTAYAVDFLLAAQAAGLTNAADLVEQLCDCLEEQALINASSLGGARNAAYAIWVLTREGRITTQLLEGLLRNLQERQIEGWQTDITAALIAASQKEMHMAVSAPLANIEYGQDGWFDEYAQKALHAFILARHFPEQYGGKQKEELYEASQEALNKGFFATFSASQGIRALMGGAGGENLPLPDLEISCLSQSGGESGLMANGAAQLFTIPQCSRLGINSGGEEPVFWQIATTGYDQKPQLEEQDNGFSINRVFLDSNGQKSSIFRQGEELTIQLEIRASQGEVNDCAIVDLLPGGVESLLSQEPEKDEKISYIDRQEDRIVIFTRLDKEPLKFEYKARATAKGRFLAPPARVEAMYDATLNGQDAGAYIEIK